MNFYVACVLVFVVSYSQFQVNGKFIIKSGTDFRTMSQVTLTFSDKVTVSVEEVSVTSDLAEDEDIKAVVAEYSSKYRCTDNRASSTGVLTMGHKVQVY